MEYFLGLGRPVFYHFLPGLHECKWALRQFLFFPAVDQFHRYSCQKIVFFDGKYHEIEDVHIGNYDFRFNFNDKKYFSINSENVVTIRIHTEPRINQVWLLLENPELNPIEMKKIGYPIVFDATHSVQSPGGLGNVSGGNREYIP